MHVLRGGRDDQLGVAGGKIRCMTLRWSPSGVSLPKPVLVRQKVDTSGLPKKEKKKKKKAHSGEDEACMRRAAAMDLGPEGSHAS